MSLTTSGGGASLPGGCRQAPFNGLVDRIAANEATFEPKVGSKLGRAPLERRLMPREI